MTERERTEVASPPHALRNATVGVMFVTALASALMAVSLAPEALYALEGDDAVDLGELATAKLDASWSGRYVRATASLDGAQPISFRRVGEPGERRIAAVPLSAVGPRLVDYAVPPRERGARFMPPTQLSGRLERVPELGLRHRGLARAVGALTGGRFGESWLLVDGDDPKSSRWTLALEALLLAFFAFNAGGILRILRRVPAAKAASK